MFEIKDGELVRYKGKNAGADVVIPNGITRIGERAFIGCNKITSNTISSSVTSIGEVFLVRQKGNLILNPVRKG